jgi:pSer/pThr/pTyr-binding forkhead associated (FHA) protein
MMGRAPDCALRLDGTERDQYISRRHCLLTLDESSLVFQDLQSRGGTYLDGQRIDRAVLALPRCDDCATEEFAQGQLLTVGGTTIRVEVVVCPQPGPAEAELWQGGETVKTSCPLRCT